MNLQFFTDIFPGVLTLLGTIVMLHVVLLRTYGTERMKRRADKFMEYGSNFWALTIVVLSIVLLTLYTTLALVNPLKGMSDRDIAFWFEAAVQAFGFLAVLAAVIPVILSENKGYANWLSIIAVAFLALGNASGNMFKFLATSQEPPMNLLLTSGFLFVGSGWVIVATILHSIYLRSFATQWRASRWNPFRVSARSQ